MKFYLHPNMISSKQQNLILEITSKFKPKMVGVFGSYARGENKRNSDLDILIDFEQQLNLLDIVGLEQELTDRLGVKVDLITLRSLDPRLKDYVEKDLILLQK